MRGEKEAPRGAACDQEWLPGVGVHRTHGDDGTSYFFSIFISAFPSDVARGQTSVICAQPCPKDTRFDCRSPEARSGFSPRLSPLVTLRLVRGAGPRGRAPSSPPAGGRSTELALQRGCGSGFSASWRWGILLDFPWRIGECGTRPAPCCSLAGTGTLRAKPRRLCPLQRLRGSV